MLILFYKYKACGTLQKEALLSIELLVSQVSEVKSIEEIRQLLSSQPNAKKISSQFTIYLVKMGFQNVAIKHLVGKIEADAIRSEVETYK